MILSIQPIFMIRILLFFIIFFSFGYFGVFAECTTNNDLTSQSFTICVNDMDPMGPDRQAQSEVTGKDAFLYILGRIANILLFAMPLIAGVSFMIAAYYYILSSGNSEKASQAKTIIKWNIIALTVAFLSYIIVNFIVYILNLT